MTEDYCERGAFALAGALAAATSRMTIGIGVVNPWTRHSMLTAMETAALAELAPDRVVLGLGASNPRWMYDQLGIPFERPIGVLRRTTEVVRGALSGDRVVTDDGRHDVDAQLAFVPPGAIPIVLGVKGEQALRLAGDVADGVLLSVLSSPAYVRWAAHHAAGARCLPTSPSGVGRIMQSAREQMRPFVARYLGLHGDHAITRVAGLDVERWEAFRRGWLDGAPRADLVDGAVLDTFAVAGRPDHCRDAAARTCRRRPGDHDRPRRRPGGPGVASGADPRPRPRMSFEPTDARSAMRTRPGPSSHRRRGLGAVGGRPSVPWILARRSRRRAVSGGR